MCSDWSCKFQEAETLLLGFSALKLCIYCCSEVCRLVYGSVTWASLLVGFIYTPLGEQGNVLSSRRCLQHLGQSRAPRGWLAGWMRVAEGTRAQVPHCRASFLFTGTEFVSSLTVRQQLPLPSHHLMRSKGWAALGTVFPDLLPSLAEDSDDGHWTTWG